MISTKNSFVFLFIIIYSLQYQCWSFPMAQPPQGQPMQQPPPPGQTMQQPPPPGQPPPQQHGNQPPPQQHGNQPPPQQHGQRPYMPPGQQHPPQQMPPQPGQPPQPGDQPPQQPYPAGQGQPSPGTGQMPPHMPPGHQNQPELSGQGQQTKHYPGQPQPPPGSGQLPPGSDPRGQPYPLPHNPGQPQPPPGSGQWPPQNIQPGHQNQPDSPYSSYPGAPGSPLKQDYPLGQSDPHSLPPSNLAPIGAPGSHTDFQSFDSGETDLETVLPPLSPEEDKLVDQETIKLAEEMAEAVVDFIEEDESAAIENELNEREGLPEQLPYIGYNHSLKTNAISHLLILVMICLHKFV